MGRPLGSKNKPKVVAVKAPAKPKKSSTAVVAVQETVIGLRKAKAISKTEARKFFPRKCAGNHPKCTREGRLCGTCHDFVCMNHQQAENSKTICEQCKSKPPSERTDRSYEKEAERKHLH